MKRVGLVVAIVVVVVGALLVARCRRETSPSGVKPGGGSGHVRGAASGRAAVDEGLPEWFVVRGAPPRRIAGRVTFEGKPVEGAVVTLNNEMIRVGTARAAERITGPDGTFDFGSRAPAFYPVGATAPGRTVEILGVNLSDPSLKPPSDQLELRLNGCDASISGTIVDASGGPIPHARVQLGGITSMTGVDADAQGAYLLCVRRGTAEVEYAAEGYGAVVLSIEVYGPMVQDVVLVPEAVITGRVVRADDGRPVEHAQGEGVPDRVRRGSSDGRACRIRRGRPVPDRGPCAREVPVVGRGRRADQQRRGGARRGRGAQRRRRDDDRGRPAARRGHSRRQARRRRGGRRGPQVADRTVERQAPARPTARSCSSACRSARSCSRSSRTRSCPRRATR